MIRRLIILLLIVGRSTEPDCFYSGNGWDCVTYVRFKSTIEGFGLSDYDYESFCVSDGCDNPNCDWIKVDSRNLDVEYSKDGEIFYDSKPTMFGNPSELKITSINYADESDGVCCPD